MLVVKREVCVWLWCCYVVPMGSRVSDAMLVNGEVCARVLFWYYLMTLCGYRGWGCGGLCEFIVSIVSGVRSDSCEGMNVDESSEL